MQTTFAAPEWEAIAAGTRPVEPAWQDSVRAVTSSPVEIVLLTGAMDTFALGRYHRMPGTTETFVSAVEDAQGSVHLTGPVAFSELISLLDSLLDFDGPAADVQADLELEPAELSCLLALADVLKERQLRAALERKPMEPQPVEPADLVAQLTTASEDSRWWVPAARLLLPCPLETDPERLASARQALQARGLLSPIGLPGPAAGELVGSLLMPLSAACVTFLGGAPGSAPQAVDTVVAIRTATAFWTLLFSAQEGQLRVRVIASQAFQLLVHLEELRETYLRDFPFGPACPHCQTPNRPEATFCSHCGQSMAGPACPQCGAALLGGAKFCAQCGHGRPEEHPQCPRCHAELQPEQRFCSQCGAAAGEPPAAHRTCACGRELAPEARFCPGCGKPV